MAPMEFGLFEIFSVLLLVIKDGDVYNRRTFQRSGRAALKISVRCVKLCTNVIMLLISGKEFCLSCFYHAF